MRLSLFNVAVAATQVAAIALPRSPALLAGEDEGYIETIVFKRGDVLSPRELALADKHGVDITKMFRHSLVRRTDGDDITIYVDNSYTEVEEDEPVSDTTPALNERAHLSAPGFDPRITEKDCGGLTYEMLTADASSFTGGVHEMYRWANTRKGGFTIWARTKDAYQRLIIAGSNSGGNARYDQRHLLTHNWNSNWVGTYDIRDAVKASLDRYQRYRNGHWRIAARGRMWCETHQMIGSSDNINQWIIGRVDQRVPGT